MSEPVKNAEIEDVLSSIRRLVSSDHRPAPRPAAAKAKPADRLVLTPALRVAEPDDGTDDDPEDTALSQPEMEQPEGAEAKAEDAPDDTPDTASDTASDTGSEPWANPEARLFDAIRSVTEDAAREAAEDDRQPAPEDARAEDHDAPATETWSEQGDDADEATPDAQDPAPDLGARIAALEQVIGDKDDHWEPDTAGSGDYAGTEVETLAWEDSSDSQDASGPDPVHDPKPHADRDDRGDFFADDAVLDEAALRDLVSEIVRQELQGALGERITRNVRKLVRREIQRALTLRDLE